MIFQSKLAQAAIAAAEEERVASERRNAEEDAKRVAYVQQEVANRAKTEGWAALAPHLETHPVVVGKRWVDGCGGVHVASVDMGDGYHLEMTLSYEWDVLPTHGFYLRRGADHLGNVYSLPMLGRALIEDMDDRAKATQVKA